MGNTEEVKPKIKGWYFVRFKSKLSPQERDEKELTLTFTDWIFFDGINWDAQDYKDLGYYVLDVIKPEKDSDNE